MTTSGSHEWGTSPEFVGPRHELRERLLLDLLLSGEPGHRILNAGAGLGSFSHKLTARGFEVTSVDSSPAAVAALEERAAGEVAQADVSDLPFDGETFDAAVLGEVLEHIPDDVGALREVARVLRPGGALAVSVPGNPALFGASDRWAGHVRRYTRAGLIRACEEGSFRVARCVAWGFPVSALYHRHLYERRLDRQGSAPPRRWERGALAALSVLLQVDRIFVGVERSSLGYLLLARRV
ncbi:MAG TPA: class I SAM-dependent methyltransferase [Gaiellaceae bacterium]|nr:class I SAM-dependent methyltransferase [Gaiellaceae bacterium]